MSTIALNKSWIKKVVAGAAKETKHKLKKEPRLKKKVALLYDVDGTVIKVEPENKKFTLKELQTLVGGRIETGPIDDDDTCLYVVDEDGRNKGLCMNVEFPYLVGKVLVVPNKLIN